MPDLPSGSFVPSFALQQGHFFGLYSYNPSKKELEQGSMDMRGKYKETMEYIGKAAPVSVPG